MARRKKRKNRGVEISKITGKPKRKYTRRNPTTAAATKRSTKRKYTRKADNLKSISARELLTYLSNQFSQAITERTENLIKDAVTSGASGSLRTLLTQAGINAEKDQHMANLMAVKSGLQTALDALDKLEGKAPVTEATAPVPAKKKKIEAVKPEATEEAAPKKDKVVQLKKKAKPKKAAAQLKRKNQVETKEAEKATEE